MYFSAQFSPKKSLSFIELDMLSIILPHQDHTPPFSLQISVLLSLFDSIFSSLENLTLCVNAD